VSKHLFRSSFPSGSIPNLRQRWRFVALSVEVCQILRWEISMRLACRQWSPKQTRWVVAQSPLSFVFTALETAHLATAALQRLTTPLGSFIRGWHAEKGKQGIAGPSVLSIRNASVTHGLSWRMTARTPGYSANHISNETLECLNDEGKQAPNSRLSG